MLNIKNPREQRTQTSQKRNVKCYPDVDDEQWTKSTERDLIARSGRVG